MHLSATALIALLQAAGVDSLTEGASAPIIGRTIASARPMSPPQSLQGKTGDGHVRRALAA